MEWNIYHVGGVATRGGVQLVLSGCVDTLRKRLGLEKVATNSSGIHRCLLDFVIIDTIQQAVS